MMNDAEMQQAIRDAHEQTSTRPIAGNRQTERLQVVKPHEHSLSIAMSASGSVAILYCSGCPTSWRLEMTHKNYRPLWVWLKIGIED